MHISEISFAPRSRTYGSSACSSARWEKLVFQLKWQMLCIFVREAHLRTPTKSQNLYFIVWCCPGSYFLKWACSVHQTMTCKCWGFLAMRQCVCGANIKHVSSFKTDRIYKRLWLESSCHRSTAAKRFRTQPRESKSVSIAFICLKPFKIRHLSFIT